MSNGRPDYAAKPEDRHPGLTEQYKGMIDEYLTNGYNATNAYLKFHPGVTKQAANTCFWRISKLEDIHEYMMERRKQAYELKQIDITRVTSEIADLAFAKVNDPDIPVNIKLKALEDLQKQLLELAKQEKVETKDTVTIGLEGDNNEDNSET